MHFINESARNFPSTPYKNHQRKFVDKSSAREVKASGKNKLFITYREVSLHNSVMQMPQDSSWIKATLNNFFKYFITLYNLFRSLKLLFFPHLSQLQTSSGLLSHQKCDPDDFWIINGFHISTSPIGRHVEKTISKSFFRDDTFEKSKGRIKMIRF